MGAVSVGKRFGSDAVCARFMMDPSWQAQIAQLYPDVRPSIGRLATRERRQSTRVEDFSSFERALPGPKMAFVPIGVEPQKEHVPACLPRRPAECVFWAMCLMQCTNVAQDSN